MSIKTQPAFSFGNPVPTPAIDFLTDSWGRNFDITPDGKRFLMVIPAEQTQSGARLPTGQIHVVLNWFEELKQRVR